MLSHGQCFYVLCFAEAVKVYSRVLVMLSYVSLTIYDALEAPPTISWAELTERRLCVINVPQKVKRTLHLLAKREIQMFKT